MVNVVDDPDLVLGVVVSVQPTGVRSRLAKVETDDVANAAPQATICLNSGLSYWDLSDELPEAVDLAVARGTHWPEIDTPATRLHRLPRPRSRLTINGKRDDFHRDDFHRDDLLSVATLAGLKRGRAQRILGEVGDAASQWRVFADDAGVDHAMRGAAAETHRLHLATG